MTDPWSYRSPGDRFHPPSAEVHNATIDAVVAHRKRTLKALAPSANSRIWQNGLMCVNSTGDTIERGDAVAIQSLQYQPTATDQGPWEDPILIATAPAWPTDAGRLAVTRTIIDDGACGLVYVSGLAIARVEVLDTTHRWVFFADDSTDPLKTGTGGQAKIVGTTPAVGTDRYALLDLDKEQPLWQFEVTSGPENTLAHLGGTLTDETFTLTDPLDLFEDVDEVGWKGYVQWIDDKFYPAGAPCEIPS